MARRPLRLTERARSMASVGLVVVGAILIFFGTVALYLREQVVDRDAFADRAVAALEDDDVSQFVGRQVVVNLIDRGSTDLIAARPLLESVVQGVLQTDAFRRVFRSAAVETNRVFFVRERRNALFDLSDAAEVVSFGARSVSPRLARELPQDLPVRLWSLSRRDFAGATLAAADSVRVLGIVLPLMAVLAFVSAIVVATDRRIAVLRGGLAVGVAGAVLAVALVALEARTLAGVKGDDAVTDEETRAAVEGVLQAYLGDLFTWALLVGLLGLVVGAAAAALDPEDVEGPVRRMRDRLLQPPRTRAWRAVRGAGAMGLGILVVLEPTLFLRLAAIGAGALLVFFGAGELLALLGRPGRTAAEAEHTRRRAFARAGLAGTLVVAALALLVVTVAREGPEPQETPQLASSAGRCNGSVALCELRLNEAVFAGTHNAFSAADSPGWFITNQRHTIKRQLSDGIRLLLIDAHWGVQDARGKVRTDFRREGRDRNRVAASLPPSVLAAAERLGGRLGAGDTEGGKRDVWLCHTVCELGATRMTDALGEIKTFLDENPGEIVILFVEPYVPPSAIARVFKQAGLDRRVVTLARDQPLPTLGELVRTDKRVVVLTEHDADGTVPWYLDGFSFVQDTPLGAQQIGQLRCTRTRGTPDSPLLMLNHWADLFPPRLRANRPFLRERVLLDRAHRCAREREMPVNLIAVDFYAQGPLVDAVDELNGERIRAHRRALAATAAPSG
jgi:hypothetical protein